MTISSEISRIDALLEELRTDVGKSTGNSCDNETDPTAPMASRTNHSIHASTPVKNEVQKSSMSEVFEAEINERKARDVCYFMCAAKKSECFCHFLKNPPSCAHMRKANRDVV